MIKRVQVAAVVVGALVFSVFLVTGGNVAEQSAFLADAGRVPNRDAVCPVRLDPDFAADAGLGLYQRLKFPVSLIVLADGGRDIQMPPMPVQRVRQALDVVDWNDCTLSAATAPIIAKWGTPQPFTLTGVIKPWCRQKADAGLPCARLLPDGGSRNAGNRNIFPCSEAVNPATCERTGSNTIYLGDDPESL